MVRLKGTDLLPMARARKLLWGTVGSCLVPLGAAVALRLPGKAAVWQVWGFPRNKSQHIVVFRAAVIRVQICSMKALQNLEH